MWVHKYLLQMISQVNSPHFKVCLQAITCLRSRAFLLKYLFPQSSPHSAQPKGPSLCLLPNTITSITIFTYTSIPPNNEVLLLVYHLLLLPVQSCKINQRYLLNKHTSPPTPTDTPSIWKWLLFSGSDLQYGLSAKDCDTILDALVSALRENRSGRHWHPIVSANSSAALDAISMQVMASEDDEYLDDWTRLPTDEQKKEEVFSHPKKNKTLIFADIYICVRHRRSECNNVTTKIIKKCSSSVYPYHTVYRISIKNHSIYKIIIYTYTLDTSMLIWN